MKRTIKYILAACLAVSSLNVFAQGLRSAYFLDGTWCNGRGDFLLKT